MVIVLASVRDEKTYEELKNFIQLTKAEFYNVGLACLILDESIYIEYRNRLQNLSDKNTLNGCVVSMKLRELYGAVENSPKYQPLNGVIVKDSRIHTSRDTLKRLKFQVLQNPYEFSILGDKKKSVCWQKRELFDGLS